jgi:hypothetical protein
MALGRRTAPTPGPIMPPGADPTVLRLLRSACPSTPPPVPRLLAVLGLGPPWPGVRPSFAERGIRPPQVDREPGSYSHPLPHDMHPAPVQMLINLLLRLMLSCICFVFLPSSYCLLHLSSVQLQVTISQTLLCLTPCSHHDRTSELS